MRVSDADWGVSEVSEVEGSGIGSTDVCTELGISDEGSGVTEGFVEVSVVDSGSSADSVEERSTGSVEEGSTGSVDDSIVEEDSIGSVEIS